MATVELIVTIKNKKGLHARAAAKFVKAASSYEANVTVTRMVAQQALDMPDDPDWKVSATSILGLMMLGAEPGTQLRLDAEGPQATEAVEALRQLVDDLFDEGE